MIKKSFQNIIALVFLLLVTGVLFACNNDKTDFEKINKNVAYKYGKGEFDIYTDSDHLLNEDNYTIFNYKDLLWKKNIEQKIINGKPTNGFIVLADDPIVEIVPRKFFEWRGQYLYIGREYGIYVNNVEDTKHSNRVAVMVIDFERSITNEGFKINIKPLFQFEYLFLSNENKYDNTKNIKLEINQALTDIIIPSPRFENGDYYFESLDTFYLKDVSLQLNLLNMQHLNPDDKTYLASQDRGIGLVDSKILFSGRSKDYSDKRIASTVRFSKDLDKDIINSSATGTHEYKFSEGATSLVKTGSAALISKDLDKPLLFGENDNVEFCYSFHTPSTWYTRIGASLQIEIVTGSKKNGTKVQINQTEVLNYYLGETEYITIENGRAKGQIYVNSGSEYFKYTPGKSFDAEIKVSNIKLVIHIYDAENTLLASQSGKINYNLQSGNTYSIRVSNKNIENSKNESFDLMIDYTENLFQTSKIIRIEGRKEFLLKFKAAVDSFDGISYSEEVVLALYDKNMNLLKTSHNNQLFYNFKKDATYHIGIKNDTDEEKNGNLYLGITENTISVDTHISQEVNGTIYYRFVVAESGDYRIFQDGHEYVLSILDYYEDDISFTKNLIGDDVYYDLSGLKKDQIIFIGVENADALILDIILVKR